MKKLRIKMWAVLIACACSIGLATDARALAIGDTFYVGKIVDGTPADLDHEAGYINILVTLATGAGPTNIAYPDVPPPATQAYDRIGSTAAGPFALATVIGAIKEDVPANTIVDPFAFNFAGSYLYILGKYGGESYVWFNAAGFTGPQSIPNPENGQVSHVSAFNTTSVPDGGSTVALFGLALTSLSLLRRKFCG